MLEAKLNEHFGFDRFRNGQREVIQKIIEGQSAGAVFPTGAGKSICYQLPAMILPGMTLVVSPLLSLMKDQLDFLRARKIPAARLDSSLEREAYNQIIEDAKSGRIKILMIAVERFRNERFRFHLERIPISLMAVDEAHCISEWGHNFRPEYLKLPAYRTQFRIPQVLLLTATAAPRVIDDMCEKFQMPRENVTVTGFYRKNLFLQASSVAERDKDRRLLERLAESPKAPTIVYVTLQKTAERVAGMLEEGGIPAAPYHAGMAAEKRESIQNRFMKGDLRCVAATIAFGMGIDKRDVRRVIHYDLPKSIEHYSQEIGRAGRDGKPAFCEVLANRDRLHTLENFVYGDTPDRSAVEGVLMKIKQNPDLTWKVRLTALSRELNIRLLPLKTLLVYLEMEGIIRPRYTYFDQYAFKYRVDPDEVLQQFHGERQTFVRTLLEHCQTKQIWTYVDMPGIVEQYSSDRRRISAALEYFDERGWIELVAKQPTDVFDILNQAFDLKAAAEEMTRLFKEKERFEVKRIHDMVRFLESDACLSRSLAAYFGETIAEDCGHCSVCKGGPARVRRSVDLPPIEGQDFNKLSAGFRAAAGDRFSVENLTRFLCGINMPAFTRNKIKEMEHFGALERYPFSEVKKWAEKGQTTDGS